MGDREGTVKEETEVWKGGGGDREDLGRERWAGGGGEL